MKDNAVTNYVRGSLEELTKVTWPTKNQAVRSTIIVLVFCLIIAIFLGAVDFLFNEIYNYLLNFSS
jgi:preprotein translocase subunit SecE